MEEKKNNKGLIIGMIIFLILCLIAIFYFMFKMVYVETSNTNTTNTGSETNTNTTNDLDTSKSVFTELTKYELQEGEEKEINIDGQTTKLKFQENKYYLNNQEVVTSSAPIGVYITNKFIIFVYIGGQFGGQIYEFYDASGNKIELENSIQKEIIYDNLRLENGILLADGKVVNYLLDFITIGNLQTVPCENNKSQKKLSDYPSVIEMYKGEVTAATYSFTYKNNKIELTEESIYSTLETLMSNASEICVIEISNNQPNN